MHIEEQLLIAVLAFEDELIDLQQLVAACNSWAQSKSSRIDDLLSDRGWVTAEDRRFLERKAKRKLAKYANDTRLALHAVTSVDTRDIIREGVQEPLIQESLCPAGKLPAAQVETMTEPNSSSSRYQWLREVASGGLGRVWLVRDNTLGREVALKEIKAGVSSDEAVRRLFKEAQITGQLQHPGIVPVYELNPDGRPFYTMKLVTGETLSERIHKHHSSNDATTEDPLANRKLIEVFLRICDAIAYAHSRGVIHRDLKPQNIVLGNFGEVIVLDWGLAKKIGTEDEELEPVEITELVGTDETQAGMSLGTPAYMSPEQASGSVSQMDERTDVYGLGAILFDVLCGRAPHDTRQRGSQDTEVTRVSIRSMLRDIATGPPPRVASVNSEIPKELDSICARAMARESSERYQSVIELRAAIQDFQAREESISLTDVATREIAKAQSTSSYLDFNRALYAFERALELWRGNSPARRGLHNTRLTYSRTAFERGDLGLALTLVEDRFAGLLPPDRIATESLSDVLLEEDEQDKPWSSSDMDGEFRELVSDIKLKMADERTAKQSVVV